MLTRVETKNYRGFASYRMEGLARVNLLVGKNNSGKSALLEAIQFLMSGGDPNVLADIAIRRGEHFTTQAAGAVEVDISHYFHGHTFSVGQSFEIVGDKKFQMVAAKIALEKQSSKSRVNESQEIREPVGVLKIACKYDFLEFIRTLNVGPDGNVTTETLRAHYAGFTKYGKTLPLRFVGTDVMTTETLAPLWDEIQLEGLEDKVRDALRILEPKISSVHILTGMISGRNSRSKAGVVVGLEGSKQRVPLGSMGDGMRRILALAANLACASNGALFADEIDTGLHYSTMSDMWKLVIQRAVESNVQVFATTHSWDCIEGLSQLCQSDKQWQDHVAIHTIDRNLPHSVAFTGESIARMAKYQIDPR